MTFVVIFSQISQIGTGNLLIVFHRVPTAQGKKGKWPNNSLSGKTQGIWKFCQTQGILSQHRENTGNFVSSSCKCSDYKSKGYCDSCRGKKIIFFQKLDRSAKSVLCM